MKIVFVYDALALFGGIEKIFIDKMNYLSQIPNYKIYIVTTNQGQHPISFQLDSKVTHVDLNIRFHTIYSHSILTRYYYLYNLKKLFKKRLQKCIEEIQPDIITTATTHFTNTVINLSCEAKKIIECHTYRYDSNHQMGWVHKKIKQIQKHYNDKQICKADAFVVLTKESAQEWSKIKKAHIIPNMIPSNTKYTTNTGKRIIAVGRLEYEKGFDLLIKSWQYVYAKHPDWTLHIYGSGSLKDSLICQIKELNLTNVVKIHEPTKYIYEEYINSSFFVMSSRFEGFGLVLAEAMSCGLPCIAFDCPYGPRNIIINNEDGILVDYLDIISLSEKIIFFIEHDEIRRKMGEKAKENIKRFYPNNIIRQWTELYESVLNNTKFGIR